MFRLAILATGAAAILAALVGGHANAQSRALPGTTATVGRLLAPNAGDLKSDKYYDSFRSNFCTNAPDCIVTFEKVPANKILRASNLNCFTSIATSDVAFQIFQLIQGPVGNPVFKSELAAAAINPSASMPTYMLNAQILSFIEGGKTPLLILNAGATVDSVGGQCELSGDLVLP